MKLEEQKTQKQEKREMRGGYDVRIYKLSLQRREKQGGRESGCGVACCVVLCS